MSSSDFVYNQVQIGSVRVLAKALSLTETELVSLVENSDNFYKVAKRIPKEDGTERLTYKVIHPLEQVLIRIRNRIIKNTTFPDYILAGRQGKSYLNNAEMHKDSIMMLSEDISRFFDSIQIKYVESLFKYFFRLPPEVAAILAELCTCNGYLVQGSPVSGDIANLIFYDKEPQLVSFAQELNLTYTRYYDDIYISSKDKLFDDSVGKLRTAIYGMFASVEVKPNKSPKKSRVMKKSARMDVHDVTVNSHKLSPSKKRTSNVRLQINQLRIAVLNKDPMGEIIKLYKSTFGQIATLKAQGSPKHKKMMCELNEIIKLVEPNQAKRFARGFRKVKTKKQLKSFFQKVSVLKKISPVVAGVVNAESKTAKERINNTL